jgi:hypothetical protein
LARPLGSSCYWWRPRPKLHGHQRRRCNCNFWDFYWRICLVVLKYWSESRVILEIQKIHFACTLPQFQQIFRSSYPWFFKKLWRQIYSNFPPSKLSKFSFQNCQKMAGNLNFWNSKDD